MTVTGKIQKYKMRETAIEELGLQGGGDGVESVARRRRPAGGVVLSGASQLFVLAQLEEGIRCRAAWVRRARSPPLGRDQPREQLGKHRACSGVW